jgi:hypothetical protein
MIYGRLNGLPFFICDKLLTILKMPNFYMRQRIPLE